ncbi:MAG: FlgO family outer membrane protein [Glaciecola sp.]
MKNSFNGISTLLMCILCVVLLVAVSGCANMLSSNAPAPKSATSALGNAEIYTHQLAQELFVNLSADRQYRYAVAGFVPVDTMKHDLDQQGPLMLLGHQLEQGLITEAVRRGFVAQDFKATNSIIMSDTADRALSRDLSHLSQLQNIDYYITGTITPQENGAMVNARVISVRNKDVVAAATGFFPADLFWQKERVSLRNGHLYRSEDATSTILIQE